MRMRLYAGLLAGKVAVSSVPEGEGRGLHKLDVLFWLTPDQADTLGRRLVELGRQGREGRREAEARAARAAERGAA